VVVLGSGGLGVVETLAGAEEKPKGGFVSVEDVVAVVLVEGMARKGDLEVWALNPPKADLGSAGLSVAVCCCDC